MSPSTSFPSRRPRARRPFRRLRPYALATLAVGVVVAAVALSARSATGPTGAAPAAAGSFAAPTASAVPPTTPAPSQSPSPIPSPVLALPGPVPSAGQGAFRYDDEPGEPAGRAGALRRYRVAVETGSGEDPRVVGAEVAQVLSAPGSWIGSGRLRLQRVPANAPHDFTVYLVTARTAGRMCAAGGVDIRVDGRPYTSCRAPGKVILNLDRWRTSVPHFVAAGVPLSVYRTYVVNHEVGHELGHRHVRCPGRGRPAPVMMQQTLFLNGCVANPWPYLDGREHTGPRL
ncbi:DUF3152 domain-containing protein [Micromonospora sp. WMMD882]|uniref:DUF3152 domain-containing protein n=1 Tax=Micromonospora sp. WMMD882 TaxID=3015151 RepID=UPI00248BC9DA|nr:DUF3152 domain-containing protein [Micromonospora sp. WMMD882]WBB79100.1 DUF3152 domain-containing protein [Micromonospora sp. WMMD882]